jgi:hypothetical protein
LIKFKLGPTVFTCGSTFHALVLTNLFNCHISFPCV